MRASLPACAVSPRMTVRRVRALPVEGQVLVELGQVLEVEDIVARAERPGPVHPLGAAAMIGVPRAELSKHLVVRVGQTVAEGQVLAREKLLFGLLTSEAVAPIGGVVESVSDTTGQLFLRAAPKPVELPAYLPGRVVEVQPGMSVTIEAEVALVQGVFGLGGEAFGKLIRVCSNPGDPLTVDSLSPSLCGGVVLGGGQVTSGALKRMREIGVKGVVTGSARSGDLESLVAGSLNPAATGGGDLGLTLVLAEGFGDLAMASATHELLVALEGCPVSISGTTQVRAGVIRPEVVSRPLDIGPTPAPDPFGIGAQVRIVRGEHFGTMGHIVAAPDLPHRLETGALASVVELDVDGDANIVVPRANVEHVG